MLNWLRDLFKCFFGHDWHYGWKRTYDDTDHAWYDERVCYRCLKRETRDTY